MVTIDKSTVEKDFRERRLTPEGSGILNWALAGLTAYLREGLNSPEIVLASTQGYREDMDVVGQWIAQCCDVDANASVATGAAYHDYSLWAAEEVGWQLKKLTFRRHLADRGFAARKGAHGQRFIVGLCLKSDSAQQSSGSNIIGKMDHGLAKRENGIVNEAARIELNERAARATIRGLLSTGSGGGTGGGR